MDGGQVVMLGVVAFAIGGSYSKISNNCLLQQLTVGKDFLQAVIDGGRFYIVKLRHHFLVNPDIFIGIYRVDTALAAGSDKDQILCSRGTNEGCHYCALAEQPAGER